MPRVLTLGVEQTTHDHVVLHRCFFNLLKPLPDPPGHLEDQVRLAIGDPGRAQLLAVRGIAANADHLI